MGELQRAAAGFTDGVEISFGPFRLLPAQRRLETTEDVVRLGSRTFDVLIALIDRAPALVSKAELLARVWPGQAVEDINLRLQIGLLRKALGDDPAAPYYVKTVHGRGYCFVAGLSRTARAWGGDTVAQAMRPDASRNNNLPIPLHAIIGRESELAELEDILQRHRLVTVIGAGGVGKTRIAVEVGRRLLPLYADGVWLIDLAPLSDPGLIASAVAAVLDLSSLALDLTAEAIARRIGRRAFLLIFDNCEHMVDAVADMAKILVSHASGLTVLATSQEGLGIADELIYRLQPLALAPTGASGISRYAAVSLFVECARRADRHFALSAENAQSVAEVCRRLDGVPLALEMAAARMPLLGIDGLRAGLAERFSLLKQNARQTQARHSTLRDLAAWSYGLLDDVDQSVFRRLAIFPGSFALDDAVALMAHLGLDQWATLDALWRLRQKSLIAVEDGAAPRYRLLETLRYYALEALQEKGDSDAVAEQHARHFAHVFQKAGAAWETMPDLDWITLYRPEIENLRSALEWALAQSARKQTALLIAAPSLHLLFALSLTAEGRQYGDRLTGLIDDDTPAAVTAGLLLRNAALWQNSHGLKGVEYSERAVTLYRTLDDQPGLVLALSVLGAFRIQERRDEEAGALLDEAWRLASLSKLERARHRITTALGLLATNENRFGDAMAYFTRALQMARDLRSTSEAICLSNLAFLEYSLGDVERAIQRAREAVDCARATAGNRGLGVGLMNLAAYLLAQDCPEQARPIAEEAFVRLGETDFPTVICLQIWAVLAAFEGRLTQAARLIGFVDAERIRRKQPRAPAEQPLYEKLMRRLEAGLSALDAVAWQAEGALWNERGALAFALTRLVSPADQPNP